MDNQKETELTVQGMADCMDMVRRELVEAGVVYEDVAPMFLTEAVLAHIKLLRDENLALHRQLAGEKLRAGRAEARADAKSRECLDLRERMAARPPIPRTPEQAIGFIGDQFEACEEADQLDRVRFQLTVHDLLSAFDWWFGAEDRSNSAEFDGISPLREAVNRLDDILQGDDGQAYKEAEKAMPRLRAALQHKSVTVTEKGPWTVDDWPGGKLAIQSQDFAHDVALLFSGDFGSPELKRAHAEEIARRLNAYPTLVYTCIGKGGEYELIGQAKGAGTMRDHADLVVYRDAQTGQLYYRARPDFVDRMALVGSLR